MNTVNKHSKSLKIFCFSLKSKLFSSIIFLFVLLLIIFSRNVFSSTKDGLSLWANFVLPSLFPFLIATELLYYTNIISYISRFLDKFMRPIFNVPGIGAYPLIMGLLSGYPIGAKIVSTLKNDNLLTDVEAERLLSFTNNSGPLFIISTVGIGLFANTSIGFLLLFTHILSCLTVGFLFRFWKSNINIIIPKYNTNNMSNSNSNSNIKKSISISSFGEILSKSIKNAINTILLIGGFIVLFSVILSLLNKCYILDFLSNLLIPIFRTIGINISFCKPFTSGLFEITNGIKLISNIHIKAISINIVLTSFLLGLSGVSILFQVLSITSKSHISIKPYILGKLMQAIFAALYTYLAFKLFPFLCLDI